MVLPPGALDVFKKDNVVPLVLRQNGMDGSHSVPRFRTKDKGVTIVTMGIAPSLVKGIRALGGRGGMGAMAIKINVRKPEEETVTKPEDKETLATEEMVTERAMETANTPTNADDLDDIGVPVDDINDWNTE